MNYPYFGQTGQGATSVPPSNQPTNVQQVAPPQQNPQFLMNNQQFQGNQMGQPLFPQPTGSVYNLNTASDIGVGQGFCGVDKSIMQSDFHNQAGFNSLTNQLASCCCELGRGQENIKYALAQSTNDIMVAADKNTDRIINYLTQSELQSLRTELQSAQFQLSQLSQTSNIVNQLMPVAKPAYITCSPYAAAFGYPYGGYNGCGCGCNSGCGCC